MKYYLTVILALLITTVFAQPNKKIEVLTLGSFHFNFPNLDLIKSKAKDQIDVLEPKYQKEIEEIVERIASLSLPLSQLKENQVNRQNMTRFTISIWTASII